MLTVIVLLKKLRAFRTAEKPKSFDKVILKELVITSVPVILQQSFVSVGNFFVNRCINGLDSTGDAMKCSVQFLTIVSSFLQVV